MKSKKSNYFYYFFFSKKGSVDIEKIVYGIIIILFLFGMAPLFFGDTFLGSSGILSSLPSWFIPLIVGIFALGVIALIRK